MTDSPPATSSSSWPEFLSSTGTLRVYAPSAGELVLLERMQAMPPNSGDPIHGSHYRVGDALRRLDDGEVLDVHGRAVATRRRASPPALALGPPAATDRTVTAAPASPAEQHTQPVASPQKRARRDALLESHSEDSIQRAASSPESVNVLRIPRSTSSVSLYGSNPVTRPLRNSSSGVRHSSSALQASSDGTLNMERMSLQDAVERGHGLLTTEHLYRFQHDPEHVKGVMCSMLRDPYQEMFGLQSLTTMFQQLVLNSMQPDQKRLSAAELTTNTHMMYHQSREGSGTRTLIDNLCRVHHINMLRVYTRSPRNMQGIACSVRYDKGHYARILERALELTPCMVLLDRVDTHFESMYSVTGHELMMAWDELLESRRNEVVPQVWFLVSTCLSLDEAAVKFHESPFMRLRDCATSSAAISDADAFQIMRQTYGEEALAAHIIPYDDRPTYPSAAEIVSEPSGPVMVERYVRSLQTSAYEQHLVRRSPYLKRLAVALQRATERSTPEDHPVHTTLPCWFHAVVATAFTRASDSQTRSVRDPSDEEFLAAMRRLPLNFAHGITLE